MTNPNTEPDTALGWSVNVLKRHLFSGVLLLNLVVAGMITFTLVQSREAYRDRTETATRNLARVLDANISGILSKIDVALLAVCDEYERQLKNGEVVPKELNRFIVRQHERLPELVALRGTDPSGMAIYGADVTPATTKSLAHRDYFSAQRKNANLGLVISKPVVGGIYGKWMIVLSRRVNFPDGSFAGLVYAGITLDYLSQSFATVDVGKQGLLSLVAADRTLLARYPKLSRPLDAPEVKINSPQFNAFLAAGQSMGTYRTKSSLDGHDRIYSFRKISLSQPLYVFVALGTVDYLANWYGEVYHGVFFMLIFLTITIALAFVFNRQWDRSRQAEQALKALEEERLKMEKLESLGVLAGGIAHDFNNILTGILGNLSFAKLQLEPEHGSQPLLEAAEKAALRAGDLAKQLLTFARGGAPVREVTSVALLVDEALSLTLSGSNVKGVVDIPETLSAVEADVGQMCQAFRNIIINAAQAMPDGGVLTITARDLVLEPGNPEKLPPGPYVRIAFTDHGEGIPEASLKKIFDPYFSTKPKGRGLGLASAYSIVKRHGGSLSVDSRVGEGSTFTIDLPSLERRLQPREPEATLRRGEAPAPLSILVMDDEEVIRQLAEGMLLHLGHQVKTCADGADAVQLYQQALRDGTPFNLVLADLTIPGGMGGREAAQQILALDPQARLVVMSGYSNDPVMANFKEYGFVKALHKPFGVEALAALLQSLSGMTATATTKPATG
ncbi:hybrid sensor histidine kinase/response regulator [Geomonas propionica]|uniref:histidine kinase n=1 Tax=Geomonas propionica TaxID=2798582 RepID=A0ABS0YW46_9BACT|nr:hybrid sensor histidine kinase/response regulator [Geomonas propionica]MBJ6802164.1 response regulator [Geomonas propionica]